MWDPVVIDELAPLRGPLASGWFANHQGWSFSKRGPHELVRRRQPKRSPVAAQRVRLDPLSALIFTEASWITDLGTRRTGVLIPSSVYRWQSKQRINKDIYIQSRLFPKKQIGINHSQSDFTARASDFSTLVQPQVATGECSLDPRFGIREESIISL